MLEQQKLNSLVVTGLGLCSSLGGAITASAAYRCGFSRPIQILEKEFFDPEEMEPFNLVGHRIAHLNPGFENVGRLKKMFDIALDDLLENIDQNEIDWDKTAFFIVLPEYYLPEGSREDEAYPSERDLRQLLEGQGIHNSNINIPFDRLSFYENKFGLAQAIERSFEEIETGNFAHIAIVAMDSFFATDRINELLEENRLKTPNNSMGYIPGEASTMVLLESDAVANARNATINARLYQPVCKEQDDPQEPSTGRSLCDVIAESKQKAFGTETVAGEFNTDLNGEVLRAREWGNVLVGLQNDSDYSGWKTRFNAASFGYVGVASPLLSIILQSRAFIRGYAISDQSIIVITEDGPMRSAIALRGH